MRPRQFPFGFRYDDLSFYTFRAAEITTDWPLIELQLHLVVSLLTFARGPGKAWSCTVKGQRTWLSVRTPAHHARGLGFKAEDSTSPTQKQKWVVLSESQRGWKQVSPQVTGKFWKVKNLWLLPGEIPIQRQKNVAPSKPCLWEGKVLFVYQIWSSAEASRLSQALRNPARSCYQAGVY